MPTSSSPPNSRLPVSTSVAIAPERTNTPEPIWKIAYRIPAPMESEFLPAHTRNTEATAVISQYTNSVSKSPAKTAPIAEPI